MKKWNLLIVNLHTEVSLTKSGIDTNYTSNRFSAMKVSVSDTMLYLHIFEIQKCYFDVTRYRYDEQTSAGATQDSSNAATTSSSPKSSKTHSGLVTPPVPPDQLYSYYTCFSFLMVY